jgi:D-alanyl-D-alanine carboxypeptidase
MDGTTAELKPNMEMSLEDLFYGMMLPSGNDAAYQIAQIGSAIAGMAM